MSYSRKTLINIVWVLIALILLGELIRDMFKLGDFIGYVEAGTLALEGKPIYTNPLLNTWPPFFSVFSIPIALGDQISSVGIRFIWLLGSLVSLGYVMWLSIRFSLHKTVTLPGVKGDIRIQDLIVLIPVLIMLRFIMENLANIQINIYMLLCATLAIYFFIHGRYHWTGLLLAFSISLKVYTIFFLLYFLFKREWKTVGWTLLFIVLINCLPILVFGPDLTLAYYDQWFNEVAPGSFISHHQNQSVLGMILRLFTAGEPGIDLSINLMSLAPETAQKIWVAAIALAAVFPIFLFSRKLTSSGNLRAILEYAVVFSLVPLLSPLAWKPYFIFLYLPYLLVYAFLFRMPNKLSARTYSILKALYWISIVCNIFSTEAFVGIYFSDVLEVFSVHAIGTSLLLLALLVIAYTYDKFDPHRLSP